MAQLPPRNPDPQWKPGDPLPPSPQGPFREFDLSKLGVGPIYRLMVDCIVPRPIALISTQNAEGAGNLAPFSYFTAVASAPPTIVVSITPKSATEQKDTLRNIEATKEFTVNLVAEWMLEAVHHTSANYPYGVDEMKKVGLTPLSSVHVKAPRVKESPVQMECVLEKLVPVGEGHGSSTLVIGRIVHIHVLEEAIQENGDIDVHFLRPVSRLGGPNYGFTDRIAAIPRANVLPSSG